MIDFERLPHSRSFRTHRLPSGVDRTRRFGSGGANSKTSSRMFSTQSYFQLQADTFTRFFTSSKLTNGVLAVVSSRIVGGGGRKSRADCRGPCAPKCSSGALVYERCNALGTCAGLCCCAHGREDYSSSLHVSRVV